MGDNSLAETCVLPICTGLVDRLWYNYMYYLIAADMKKKMAKILIATVLEAV